MRFVVVSYGVEPLDFGDVGDAAPRSHRYRDRLMDEGKLIEHAHLAGQRGHAWVFEVDSVDELDEIIANDPMTAFSQNDPEVLPLCSYARMAERERQLLGGEVPTVDVAARDGAASSGAEAAMRFLVIAHGIPGIDPRKLGDAPKRANRYREELVRQGKLSMHGHIAAHGGHVWIYHVSSVDELDEVMSSDPMSAFCQNDPVILPMCSYERMHAREREFFPNSSVD